MYYQVTETYTIKTIRVSVLRFELPLAYFDEDDRTIQVMARICQKSSETQLLPPSANWLAFIQGGPGFPCAAPSTNTTYINILLEKGYTPIFIDQRGTGLSTPLNGSSLKQLVPMVEGDSDEEYTEKQLKYVLNFTGASIVEDYERIREALLGEKKWTLHGQSFGGFCSFIYLSKYPKSIIEVFLTGGVPPINHGPDTVYTATYSRALERNNHYYTKFPNDVEKVKTILTYLSENEVVLPDGGNLSVERFQQNGLLLGSFGGADYIHNMVDLFYNDLVLYNEPSRTSLLAVTSQLSFDTNILYALFQESIYCDGNNPSISSSNWSAERLRYLPENERFVFDKYREGPTYFTSEMVYKSMYDDYVELRQFKKLAYALHSNTKWPELYDVDVLKTLSFKKVPVVGAVYVQDLFVEFNLTMKIVKEVFNGVNFRPYIEGELFHDGYRSQPEKVMNRLFTLMEYESD